jgi:hypothetical protein
MRVRDQSRRPLPAAPTPKETVMNTIDIHRYRMLVRVRDFGAAHREFFPAAGTGGRLFAAIAKAVDQLSTYATTEACGEGAVREGARSKAAARQALWQALDAIRRTARAIDTPGLGAKFRIPSARNDHELATAAGSFGRVAAPLKAQFLAHGMPKTFLADLRAALEAFERATQDRLAAREARAGAKAGIDMALEDALRALARLDAVVLNTLRDKPTLQTAWTSARRVAKVRANAGREPAPADATPATTPESSASA